MLTDLSKDEANILLQSLLASPVSADLGTVLTGQIKVDQSMIDLVNKLNKIINNQEREKPMFDENTDVTPASDATETTPAVEETPATETPVEEVAAPADSASEATDEAASSDASDTTQE